SRILVVDDDRAMCQLLIDLLREDGYEADVAYDGESALEKCRTTRFDLAITDRMMPKMRGIELVQRLREIDASALVLLITAFGTIENAVEAMRAGAFHYVTTPLQEELKLLRTEVQARNRFQNIIGQSSAMQMVFETIAQVSDLPANVLIEGESGTGKAMSGPGM